MNWHDAFELASYIVTVIGLPFAIAIFFYEQRKERENEEEEQYQHLSDAYNEFLKIVLDHADLQLRAHEPLPSPTPEQRERMRVIFDMLISLFERAYLVAYKDDMDATERRRWNSWDDQGVLAFRSPRVRPQTAPNLGAKRSWVWDPARLCNDEWALSGASSFGPGYPRAQGRVAPLAWGPTPGRGSRLALHPWPPRRGAI